MDVFYGTNLGNHCGLLYLYTCLYISFIFSKYVLSEVITFPKYYDSCVYVANSLNTMYSRE